MTVGDPKRLSAAKLALLAARLHENVQDMQVLAAEPIALVGIGCRLPGDISNPDELWKFLLAGGDAITEVPRSRWDAAAYYDADPATVGKINTRFGGFLNDVADFDALAFGIAPREAQYMDPQQRLLLEVAWEAFDDAGSPIDSLRGSKTGVFFGVASSDYARLQLERPAEISAHTLSGTAPSIAAGRLSYLYDLRGPCMVIETACSSSLVAVHSAVQSLRNRESNVAVAGGVSVNLAPEQTISLAKWGMLSPDGHCKTFDAGANGFVRSEGCVLVVMKRLGDALRDRDRVYAVIRGTAINQDGRSNVLTAPNGEAQRDVMRAALRQAQIAPSDVTYVETHGTGTKVGDPIEVEALIDVVGRERSDGSACHLGAIKANFGHLEPAAGVLGLVKAALCLQRGAIPRQIHFTRLNPLVSLDGTALRIPTETVQWPRGVRTRVAGVSSFGFSGTNAHVVLEEAPQLSAPKRRDRAEILPMSAHTPRALATLRAAYERLLSAPDVPDLADLCYSAAARRAHRPYRAAYVARSIEELRAQLGNDSPGSARSARPVFVFSGQGTGWAGMGASLLRDEPVFAAAIARCDDLLHTRASWRVADLLRSGDVEWLLDTERYQVALFSLQVALVELWASWGVEPSAVVGHSVGEIAAAHTAGALSIEQALDVVMRRARLMRTVTPVGAMAVAELSPQEADRLVTAMGTELVVAAYNGPRSVTVAGASDAVAAFVARPELTGRFARRLPVDRAFHSPAMAPAAAVLAAELGRLVSAAPNLEMVSTVTGERVGGATLDHAYWARNVRDPVRFAEALTTLLRGGHDCFIEIGPHPGLLPMIQSASADVSVLPSLRRDADGRGVMLGSLARLYEAGANVRWANVVDADAARCISLPNYTWQRERLWFDGAESQPSAPVEHATWPGARVDSAFPAATVFATTLTESSPSWLAEHRLAGVSVVPGAALIDLAVSAAQEVSGSELVELVDGSIVRPLVIPRDGAQSVQVGLVADGPNRWRLKISARAAAATDDWLEYFGCSVRIPAALAQHAPPRSADLRSLDVDAVYERLRAAGVDLGAAFRRVERLRHDDGIAIVDLKYQPESTEHALDPRALDGCFHGTAAFFTGRDDAWLPVGFASLKVAGRRIALASSVVRLASRSSNGDELVTDLALLDSTGRTCGELAGFRVRAVPAATLRERVAGALGPILHEPKWVESEAAGDASPAGVWLLLADRGGTAEALAARLGAAGVPCEVVDVGALGSPVGARDGRRSVDATDEIQLSALLQGREHPISRIAVFTALDVDAAAAQDPLAAQDRVSRVGLAALKAFGGSGVENLWFVTRGARRFVDCAGAAQAPLWGLAAVAAHEYPSMRCRVIDLDPGEDRTANAVALYGEACVADDGETRVARSEGRRLVERLVAAPRPSREPPRPWRVVAPASGQLTDVARVTSEQPRPSAGEVVVETDAVGLNFRDVLNALGALDVRAAALGGECAGRVVAVGEGVGPEWLGRRVMAFAMGALASHVCVARDCVAEVPVGLGTAEAASLPVVFLTALHGLEDLARLRQGEVVLIHAGAGGVGLAACQVALRCGARVIATASSPAKRAFLHSLGVEQVFSSRDESFVEAVLASTRGDGVDVVLNSLSDGFVDASFKTLRRGGRFVELGKRGIWSEDEARTRRPDARYLPFDLSVVAARQPERIHALFERFLERWSRGEYRAIPLRSYTIDDLPHALEYMARARHIGKLVVTVPKRGSVVEGTYLLTGANAGVAPSTIDVLAGEGAERLVLWSRAAPSGALAAASDRCRSAGIAVEFARCDVGDDADMQRRAAELPEKIDGVLHLAGVVDDAPLATLSWERFAAVLRPKIAGSWNLHRRLLDKDLRRWVGFSSVAALFGWPGQGAYAAGNAYMDALAHYRAARGWPALTINWGPWRDAGMAARAAERHETDFDKRGLALLASTEGEVALRDTLRLAGVQYAAIRYDSRVLPRGSLTRVESGAGAATIPTDAGARLASVTPRERPAVLRGLVEAEAARILGLKAGYRFDAHRPLNEIGLDSLLAVQLANAIGAAFRLPASATLLFDYPTVDALCGYLRAELHADSVDDAPAARPTGQTEVSALSDSEAEAELLAELDALHRTKHRS